MRTKKWGALQPLWLVCCVSTYKNMCKIQNLKPSKHVLLESSPVGIRNSWRLSDAKRKESCWNFGPRIPRMSSSYVPMTIACYNKMTLWLFSLRENGLIRVDWHCSKNFDVCQVNGRTWERNIAKRQEQNGNHHNIKHSKLISQIHPWSNINQSHHNSLSRRTTTVTSTTMKTTTARFNILRTLVLSALLLCLALFPTRVASMNAIVSFHCTDHHSSSSSSSDRSFSRRRAGGDETKQLQTELETSSEEILGDSSTVAVTQVSSNRRLFGIGKRRSP